MAERVEISGAQADVYSDVPDWNGLRTAAIGKFRCKSLDAGQALLEKICTGLKADGFHAAIGPMDGSTWQPYRLVIESDGSPPFLMEPVSGPDDRESFAAAGFDEISHYVSSRQELMPEPPTPGKMDDVSVETWDGSDPGRFFAEVHAVSSIAFAGNAFFQPISQADFLAIYVPLVPLLRPDLIFFARSGDGAMQGFFFAIPDYQQGPQPADVIFKTYASLLPGVGRILVDHAVAAAAGAGFRSAIHALMHVDNRSTDRSARIGGEIFRRYALMGRLLNG